MDMEEAITYAECRLEELNKNNRELHTHITFTADDIAEAYAAGYNARVDFESANDDQLEQDLLEDIDEIKELKEENVSLKAELQKLKNEMSKMER